jgi:hypothetical protein
MTLDERPSFFVPGMSPEQQEEAYAKLAAMAGERVLPIEERIYSITFKHDRETWTATVGQALHGTAIRKHKRGRETIEREVPVSDRAVVLAIFPSYPYKVVHDGTGAWANPFFVGTPSSARRFAG